MSNRKTKAEQKRTRDNIVINVLQGSLEMDSDDAQNIAHRARNWRTVFKLVPIAVGVVGWRLFGLQAALYVLATWYMARGVENKLNGMAFTLFTLGMRCVDGFDEFVESLESDKSEENV